MYKYQKEINDYLDKYPKVIFPAVHSKDIVGYRFTHSGGHINDSIPNYIIKPSRVLEDSKKDVEGYALSFYDSQQNAVTSLEKFLKNSQKAKETLGDSVTEISLVKKDGNLTYPNNKGHFCLFEFPDCDITARVKNGNSVIVKLEDDEDD
ncbi:MAG: hypothetical protein K6G31_04495 [Paludibacteraceae bacterium]|nr:hypothetical protein [Paludibacteraceae bacterium]